MASIEQEPERTATGSSDSHSSTSAPHGDVEKQPHLDNQPQPAQESFWSPKVAPQRAAYLKVMGGTTMIICILIWCVVSIYWGSVYKENQLSPHLQGWIINRDAGNVIGDTVQQALLDANQGPKPHSTWKVVDPNLYKTNEEIDIQVAVKQSTWIVVEIAENATARLFQARSTGDATWDPRSVVSLTYATSRNFQAIPSVVLSPALATLTNATLRMANQLAGLFFSTATTTDLANLARAPQTVVSPIVLNQRDIRPYNVSVALAVLVIGLIYLIILSFSVTMANFSARQPLQSLLNLRSLILMRFLAPLTSYFFISLMFALLNIAFKLPYGRSFTYGAGFMVYWCTTFCGMAVLGLVTECFLSLIGPKFHAFSLLSFIIINVSVANLPLELSPSFYKYGVIMPFYQLRQVYNYIIFNVGERSELIKYFGILWAWLAVIAITFPIWIWRERRQEIKARQQKQIQAKGL